MFQLGDGSGIEISTGKIVSGKGADINRAGVTPDQVVDYPVADLAAGQDPQLGGAAQVAAQLASRQPAASPSSGSATNGSAPQVSAGAAPQQPAPGGATTTVIKPAIKTN